jgi:hypothetical protein
VWKSAPLETVLLNEADLLVGDEARFLVIDDTALPKKGSHSVGVAAQFASSLGKTANCQSLVSVTLASREVPVMVGRGEPLCCRGKLATRANDASIAGPNKHWTRCSKNTEVRSGKCRD